MSTTTTKSPTEQKHVLLSKKGMKELRKSIAQLEHDRNAIRRSLKENDKNASHDDRYERTERLMRLDAVEVELADKQHTLSRAKLIPSKRTRVRVAVGSVVDLIDQKGQLFRYTLVESIEANPSDGRISLASPLGSSLLGKTAQDVIESRGGSQLKLVRIT